MKHKFQPMLIVIIVQKFVVHIAFNFNVAHVACEKKKEKQKKKEEKKNRANHTFTML